MYDCVCMRVYVCGNVHHGSYLAYRHVCPTSHPPPDAWQTMAPAAALRHLTHTNVKTFFYHHMPILTLFGNLYRRDVMVHNGTALQTAAVRARTNLSKCIVGVTEDSHGTHELLSYVPALATHSCVGPHVGVV